MKQHQKDKLKIEFAFYFNRISMLRMNGLSNAAYDKLGL